MAHALHNVRNVSVIISCEHACNFVPPTYRKYFPDAEQLLDSHRGWDPGAAQMARTLAAELDVSAHLAPATRLLVEPNRSLTHPDLFSSFTRVCDGTTKQQILEQYYHPYRSAVQNEIQRQQSKSVCVLHLSVHSFTPELHGTVRKADIGFLYDPRRRPEREFCQSWLHAMAQQRCDLKLRRNYPYRGIADGFTTALRKQFPAVGYLGIELEVNQKHWQSRSRWNQLSRDLAATLRTLLHL